ncbi:light-harvesting protein [Nannochloropsis gaditana]|uniref:Light-harvesting protein n=1 Tax=Nannochloropsis gaditana TaxID=72520 RepID=W7TX20_9STRA|nr:light-harvesting protein [Nannochloropsis gaditana]
MKFASLLSLLAAPLLASAFLAPAPKTTRARGVVSMVQSKALPFLAAPKKLDGSLVGDFGFDPMGISDQVANLKYVRAAELKHGRVAMLGFLGWVVTQFVHLPGEIYAESNPLKAIAAVPLISHVQIFLFIAAIELATLDRTYTADKPWDLGFDPMNMSKGKSEQQMKDLELKELKNGRLAMIAIIGLMAQTAYTGIPLFS